jgi:hypothetical protein
MKAFLSCLFALLLGLASYAAAAPTVTFGVNSPAQFTLVPGVGFTPSCSQSSALIARMDGGENKSAVDTAVCGMVTDGNWSLMDAFYVFAINSTANANLNWISPSFSLTVNGTCTFTANQGYTGDGSTCFLNTGYNTNTGTNWALNSAAMGACDFSASTPSSATLVIGNHDASTFSGIETYANGHMEGPVNSTSLPQLSRTNSQGLAVISRTNSSNVAYYLNGAAVSGSPVTELSSAVTNANVYVLALNSNGTAADFSSDQVGAAFASGGLTSTQVTQIRNRLNTYFSAVGAPSGC